MLLYSNLMIDRLIILIDCGIALKEVPLTPGPEVVSIVAHESEYISREQCNPCTSPIPVHPITAGSAKLQYWLIRKAEETLENNLSSPQERQ